MNKIYLVYLYPVVHVSFQIEQEMVELLEIISDILQEIYLLINKIYNTTTKEKT